MTTNIVAELTAERDRLSAAIAVLTGGAPRRGRPKGSKNGVKAAPNGKKGPQSAAAKKAQSLRMRKYWAARKQAKPAKAEK